MATTLSSLETQARIHLKESTASFWSSAELVQHANNGIKDLYRAVVDLEQEFFLTEDVTNVYLSADTTTLTGVPSDVYKVKAIEHADITTSPGSGIMFRPKDFNSHEFTNARALPAQDPSSGLVIYYTLWTAGAPVAAPTVRIAPKISSAIAAASIRFVYVPTIAAKVANDNNPIPGESDAALIAYMVAYARAKEREDRSPDPNWLAIYSTEKANLLTSLTPRQTQEPEYVPDLFGAYQQ